MRILKRLLAGLVILIVAGLAAMYVADPVITDAARRAALRRRYRARGTACRGAAEAELPAAAAGSRTISEDALDQAVAYGEETGSHALLVYHDGALQLEHYYPGHDRNSRTSTQSMHKSVLALVVGIAIRDGFIASVDDPAARYLPEWAGDGRAKITIRQMLQQASGIGFPTVGFNPVGGFFQLTLGGDIAPIALDQPLDGEPGARFDYNSVNPQNLGLIIQRATGKRYADYLSEVAVAAHRRGRRLRRAGFQRSTAWRTSSAASMPPRVPGCRSGCCTSTRGVYNGEQVVPASWMREVVTPSARNPNYGYLTWLGNEYQEHRYYNRKTRTNAYSSEPFATRDMVYLDGFGGQRVYIAPSLGLVIVRTGSLATGLGRRPAAEPDHSRHRGASGPLNQSISRRNSFRVCGCERKLPSMQDVVMTEFCFSTPRIIMHMCCASTTTPTPLA